MRKVLKRNVRICVARKILTILLMMMIWTKADLAVNDLHRRHHSSEGNLGVPQGGIFVVHYILKLLSLSLSSSHMCVCLYHTLCVCLYPMHCKFCLFFLPSFPLYSMSQSPPKKSFMRRRRRLEIIIILFFFSLLFCLNLCF